MKKLSIIILLLAFVPLQVNALSMSNDDLLALVAMPLAVAAVSDVTGVPQQDLASLVATLNNANVPAVQEVQILRYAPVALVQTTTVTTTTEQPFVTYVQQQVAQGIVGDALVPVVFQQLRTYDVQPVLMPAGSTIIVDDTFIPTEVQTRVTTLREQPVQVVQPVQVIQQPVQVVQPVQIAQPAHIHPHGGPPGQLKKIAGVQTGAEIVHGYKPGHVKEHHVKQERVILPPMTSAAPPPVIEQRISPGQLKKMEGGGGDKGKGHGNEGGGKGHGKGHDR